MTDFTPEELAGYRGRLLELKRELERFLESASEASAPVTLDQTSVGRLSRMDAMQSQAMAQETERRRITEIKRIEAALARMDEGEYGYCIVSGERIPDARLDLDPAAATTVGNAK